MTKLSTLLLLACCLARPAAAEAVPAYLQQADASFAWQDVQTKDGEGFKVHYLKLTSQTWHGVVWTHWLAVVVPEKLSEAHGDRALLFIDGGNQEEAPTRISEQLKLLGDYAARTGTVMALLRQVPNQPLFEGLREDALIAYTFVKFFETEDPTWPLLLPMTRSAMRAMDAVQAFAHAALKREITGFFITGASKRGWTTWLTGAVDPRVIGIAPMVIDTLNFPEQMKLQKEAFGNYSIQIQDYVEQKLPDRVNEPLGNVLVRLCDPYSMRERLTCPKLLVIGTNDPYWPIDAAKLYFEGLPGLRYLHYMPNMGHGPGPSALAAISGFYHALLMEETLPQFGWSLREEDGEAVLVAEATDRPEKVELWSAASTDRDFRNETFGSEEVWADAPPSGRGETPGAARYEARFQLPEEGFAAAFLSLTYRSSLGHTYTLCTLVQIYAADSFF